MCLMYFLVVLACGAKAEHLSSITFAVGLNLCDPVC